MEVHAVALRRGMSMHGHSHKETANGQSARYGYTDIASRTWWKGATVGLRSLGGCHTHKVSVSCQLIPVGTRAIHKRTTILAGPCLCDHRNYPATSLAIYGGDHPDDLPCWSCVCTTLFVFAFVMNARVIGPSGMLNQKRDTRPRSI